MNIRIVGLGNVLMSDDGFGPYAVRVLEAFYEMPENVQVIDAGTPGLDLTPYLFDADVVIFLDTVKTDACAGAIRTFTEPEILRSGPPTRLSPHDPGIKDSLMALAAAGHAPKEVLLIGVVPEWVATGVSLSGSLRSAIAPAISVALSELERLGCSARPRPVPRRPDTWWEREPAAAYA
jgi:hydrogenase maturation protease